MTSGGDYVVSDCLAVVTGGTYLLTVTSTGWGQAEISCYPRGGGYVQTDGAAYGEVAATGRLAKV